VAPPEPVAAAYVALCLRLRRLVPALVDAGAVDPATVRAVAAEPRPAAAALVREAGRLADALPDAGLDARRERFLAGQLRAVEWRARRLAGQHVAFDDEVRACLDVVARPGEPDRYRAAHRELAALLPDSGPLAARLADHRRRDAVPTDRIEGAVGAVVAVLRDRTESRYALPPGEGVELRVVDGVPWRALQTYRGRHRSVVRVNATAGTTAGALARLVAHETYPGHHVECCRHELAAARGRVELSVTVLGTPQTVGSEGLADAALDVAVGPRWGRVAAPALAAAGVRTDGPLAEGLDAVRAALRPVRLDAALMLHGARPGVDAVEAAEAHLRRWLLLDPARARRLVGALARPLWRAHVAAVVAGVELAREHLSGAPDPAAEHGRLLDAPLTPSTERARNAPNSATGGSGSATNGRPKR
jgi:hypothetical protein